VALIAGSRIGPYEVTSLIGKGGMGEVYRARDVNLGRDVAIKVLPDALSADPDRLARFEREARTLAALNHPNIAGVYGLEKTDGIRALVMELVEGSTLADRIAAGPMPIDEVLHIAIQIAEALEAAHDHGVIHRDLKPLNVKVRSDGTAKVLDFGLAKALEPIEAASGLSMSPTITTPALTRMGRILGTAAYMSPEQARGKPVDRRADIWAFGCVLFEMLAGRGPFPEEETVSDTVAGILRAEPAWDLLPSATPVNVRALLLRCLDKDPRHRLSHIAEARIAIEERSANVQPVEHLPKAEHRRRTVVWPVLALMSALTAAALAVRIILTAAPDPLPARFDIAPPPGALPMTSAFGRLLEVGEPISPDGRTVAFVASYRGRPSIWTRSIDSPIARPLANTEEAERPVWAADGQSLAFIAQGRLKRVGIAGGPATNLASTQARDLSWGPQDVILIGGEQGKPLLRVPGTGGSQEPVTALAVGETSHDYPYFLPDGRHFLYMARHGANAEDWDLYAGSLDSISERHLVRGIHAAARYSPTGHLLFVQGGELMAARFNLSHLETEGDPFRIIGDVTAGPRAGFSLSRNGTLAYLSGPPARESQLTWFKRDGSLIGTLGPSGRYQRARLSRDGRMIAFDDGADILALDIDRGLTSKVISRAGADFAPVFSPDGNTIAFASSREPATNAGIENTSAGHLYTKNLGSIGDGEIIFRSDRGKQPTDWSRDGRYLAYTSRNDVWALTMPPSADTQPIQVTNTSFAESEGVFSPDGRWLAYQSNDSPAGQDVYVQPFPGLGRRYTISVGGGSMPRWNNDGSEVFYVSPDFQLMSVSIVRTGTGLTIGRPVPLFGSRAFRDGAEYQVSADGRFLLSVPRSDQPDISIAVIVNWTATMKP
jgi:Tol biopolymer transport system component